MDQNQYYALVTRPARFTWEPSVSLAGTDQASAQVQIDFPRPVQIVSVYPSISPIGGADTLPVPELDDLLVQIDLDTAAQQRLTSRFDSVQATGVGTYPNVTLGSFRDSVLGSRVLLWELTDPRPTLTFTFAWKRLVSGGPYYQDVQVGLALNCNFLGGK